MIRIGLMLQEMIGVIATDFSEMPLQRSTSIARVELCTAPASAKADVVVQSISPAKFGEWFHVHKKKDKESGKGRQPFGRLK